MSRRDNIHDKISDGWKIAVNLETEKIVQWIK